MVKKRRNKTYKKYNNDLAQKVIADYDEGKLTVIQIMNKHGISQSLLYRCLEYHEQKKILGGENISINIDNVDDDFNQFKTRIEDYINS